MRGGAGRKLESLLIIQHMSAPQHCVHSSYQPAQHRTLMTRTLWDTLAAFGQWDFSDSLQLRSQIITFSRAIAFSNRARVPVDNIQIIRSRMEALSGPNSDESFDPELRLN